MKLLYSSKCLSLRQYVCDVYGKMRFLWLILIIISEIFEKVPLASKHKYFIICLLVLLDSLVVILYTQIIFSEDSSYQSATIYFSRSVCLFVRLHDTFIIIGLSILYLLWPLNICSIPHFVRLSSPSILLSFEPSVFRL